MYVTHVGTASHCTVFADASRPCPPVACSYCALQLLSGVVFNFFQDAEQLIIEHITQSASMLPQATASLLAQQPGLLPGSVNAQAAVQVSSISTDTQDQLRQLVAEELSQATQKIVAAQVLCLKPCLCICCAVLADIF